VLVAEREVRDNLAIGERSKEQALLEPALGIDGEAETEEAFDTRRPSAKAASAHPNRV
jgi:hypothetical protein